MRGSAHDLVETKIVMYCLFNQHLRVRYVLVILLVILLANTGRPGNAQFAPTDPVVHLSDEQFCRFDEALKALAKQANVAFVVEGEPLKSSLSKHEAENMMLDNVRLSEAVRTIAMAYDYDAKRTDKTYVLEKRYTDVNDLPSVTLEECKDSVQDMVRILSVWNPGLAKTCWFDPDVKTFIASLTQEQLQAMSQKRVGLPVSTMSSDQQKQVWRLALHFYVQRPQEKDISPVLAQIKCAMDEHTMFVKRQLRGLNLFGYEGTLITAGKPYHYFRPLSHPSTVISRADGTVGFITYRGSKEPLTDPTDPVGAVPEPGKVATQTKYEPSIESTSLGVVVASLSTRQESTVHLAVDETLAAKRVVVIGAETVSPVSVFRALADVYGLRIYKEIDGTLRLTRHQTRPPKDIKSLPDVLRMAFPEPFLRAMHIDKLDEMWTERRQEVMSAPGNNIESKSMNSTSSLDPDKTTALQNQMEERTKSRKRMESSPFSLRVAAVRRLRVGVEPRLDESPQARVMATDLSETDRMALACVLMGDCLQGLSRLLSHEPPEYITSFDQTVLTGGVYKDRNQKTKFSLFLEQPPSPNGNVFFRSDGFTGVDFLKP